MSTKKLLFNLALLFSLFIAAHTLFIKLPKTPLVKKFLTKSNQYNPAALRFRLEKQIDHFAPEGNIFLVFKLKETYQYLSEYCYFAWTYLLYPRKVFVTESKTQIINNKEDLNQPRSLPDKKWLLAHNIEKIIFIENEADGRIYTSVTNIEDAKP